ncbi:MAG TPA: type II secretion system protein [Lacipirellulaceae bacterium]|nr:type II secretion system protein [Lacipirellulaceae bacterium]
MRSHARHLRAGFSLLELLVVVMIIGIIATIAAPKLLGTSLEATDNGLRHTLSVIRGAIDTYSAEHEGELPGADGQELTLKNQLMPYLRGKQFPVCSVGPAANNEINMVDYTDPVSIDGTETTKSWLYKYKTGDFHVNCDDLSSDGATTYDKF